MLVVLSPAKSLDFESPVSSIKATKPALLKDSEELVDQLKSYTPEKLVGLMGISEKLGILNAERYMSWSVPFTKKNAKHAIYAFKGDVYTGLEAESFSQEDILFAQEHLRILSGLYGILRPLDLIQPYRLEMGTKLKNQRGDDLYDFWGNKPAKAINKQLKALKQNTLINLASNEYFKSVDLKTLDAEIITPVFKDYKNGKYKIISFFAKKARGLMSAYIIKNKITSPDGLKKFKVSGYRFDKSSSTENEWIFLRDEPNT